MNLKIYFSLFILVLASMGIFAQSRISINIPSAVSEADFIWRTIRDIRFFEQNNYQLRLPKGDFMQSLLKKAREGTLSDSDYEQFREFFIENIYYLSDYEKGSQKIESELVLVDKMVEQIIRSPRNWNFMKFSKYQVNLTLYGSGGSFDPEQGSLLIMTTPEGEFMQYDSPANTIIHEIVHIGIEESIIAKYNVPHTLKERIVDQIVFLNFKEILPEYRIQDMGEYRIDPYLNTKGDLKDLQVYVAEIMSSK